MALQWTTHLKDNLFWIVALVAALVLLRRLASGRDGADGDGES